MRNTSVKSRRSSVPNRVRGLGIERSLSGTVTAVCSRLSSWRLRTSFVRVSGTMTIAVTSAMKAATAEAINGAANPQAS